MIFGFANWKEFHTHVLITQVGGLLGVTETQDFCSLVYFLSAHYGSIYLGKENGVLLGFSVGIICVTFACWKLYIDDWRDDED